MFYYDLSMSDAYDSPGNVSYSISIIIWMTLFVESWKRKQAYIAHQWQVRDLNKNQTERRGFRAVLDVDPETQSIWRRIY